MSQENGGSQQATPVAAVADTIEHDKFMFVCLFGQTQSPDEVKSQLSQFNSSLLQIGQLAEKHRDELVNVVSQQQQLDHQFNYDQQLRVYYNNESNFEFELLFNANVKTFKQSMRNLLTAGSALPTGGAANLRVRKYFLNLTHDPSNNGDINLADSLFTYDDLHVLINEQTDEVKKYLKPSSSAATTTAAAKITLLFNQRTLDVNKNWKLLEKLYPLFSVSPLTPPSDAAAKFSDRIDEQLEKFFNKLGVDQLLHNSRSTGTLKITKPCLYIFPASQGDSAYFAINGYSMLINGGYDRLRPCFFKFINMLQQIDAILVTHTDSDALAGLSSFFKKKIADPEQTKPNVLTVLGNLIASSPAAVKQPNVAQAAVNLISQEISSNGSNGTTAASRSAQSDVDVILDAIDKLQIKLQPLVKSNENLISSLSRTSHSLARYEHINLYYKLGHGSLDLYVLSPYANSLEYKEYYQQQHHGSVVKHLANQKSHLAVQQIYRHLPLSHLASAVVLLAWLPSSGQRSGDSNALRLLFTGNAPQHIIFNALDKIKDFELIAEPVYRVRSTETSAATSMSAKKPVNGQASKDNGLNSSMSNGSSSRNQATSSGKPPVVASSSATNVVANKPVPGAVTGQMNGNHEAKVASTNSQTKPPVPSNKPAAKPASAPAASSSAPVTAAAAATTSAQTNTSTVQAKPDSAKKHPPIPSHNVPSASKKKPSSETANDETKKATNTNRTSVAGSTSSSQTTEAAKNVNKKELTNGNSAAGGVKQSQSDTTASTSHTLSSSGQSKSSLGKAAEASSKASAASSSSSSSKPTSAASTNTTSASASSATASTESKPAAAATTKPAVPKAKDAKKPTSTAKTSGGHSEVRNVPKRDKVAKTLTLSVDDNKPATGESTAATAAAAAAAAVTTSVTTAVVPSEESVAVESATSTPAASTEPGQSAEVSSTSEQPTERVVHEEKIEEIEKVEQVVNVEHELEQIEQALHEPVPNDLVLEEQQQPQISQEERQEPVVSSSDETSVKEAAATMASPNIVKEVSSECELQQQPHLNDLETVGVESNCQFQNESPNLSPVKKDFGGDLNGGDFIEHVTNAAAANTCAAPPLMEDQFAASNDLIIENNTNSEIEIVSGNLNTAAAVSDEPAVISSNSSSSANEANLDYLRNNEDVMTRSFIEDESNPQSNPFNIDSTDATTPHLPAAPVNGHNLNESCDLNRTHELFEGENDSSINNGDDQLINNVKQQQQMSLNDLDDKLINGLESLKLDASAAATVNTNGNHQEGQHEPVVHVETVHNGEQPMPPDSWNLLELPAPVNPMDGVVVEHAATDLDVNHQSALIDETPLVTNAATAATNTAEANVTGSAEKKSLLNGKKAAAAASAVKNEPVKIKTQSANQSQAPKQVNKPAAHPVHPVYVELTYVPSHGNEHYCDVEFFKRIRARHYVLSSLDHSEAMLNALCDGKEHWEDKSLQVSLVPTYESETLRKWFLVNEERLSKLHIDILPAANNATISIEDQADLSCNVYKLEF